MSSKQKAIINLSRESVTCSDCHSSCSTRLVIGRVLWVCQTLFPVFSYTQSQPAFPRLLCSWVGPTSNNQWNVGTRDVGY